VTREPNHIGDSLNPPIEHLAARAPHISQKKRTHTNSDTSQKLGKEVRLTAG